MVTGFLATGGPKAAETSGRKLGMAESRSGVYLFSGNPRSLQIWIELTYVGTAFGDLPSFAQFAERLTDRNQRSFGHLTAAAAKERRSGERISVRWQQKVERPTTVGLPIERAELPAETTEEREAEATPPPSDPRPSNVEEAVDQEEDGDLEGRNAEAESTTTTIPRPEAQIQQPEALPRIISSSKSRLFTYVDGELANAGSTAENAGLDSAGLFRPHKVVPLSNATIRHPVRENPTREQRRKHRQLTSGQNRMQIVGYFGSWNEPYDPQNEVVLCTLQLVGQRVLHAQPDFGKHSVDTPIGHYSFRVWMEPTAQFDSIGTGIGQEFDIADDQSSVFNSVHEDQFKFELPDKGNVLLTYLIVIEEAIDFPHDGLCIEYEVELPPNMRWASVDQSRGRTQRCATLSSNQSDIARFSFPIELCITYDLNFDSFDLANAFRWPRLMFRVLAEDQWSRYYVDGYGSTSLPTAPSTNQKLTVDCWRPVNPKSSLARLREQFIGQPIDLLPTDSSTMKTAFSELGRIHSKVGIAAEGSGTITLSVNCMRQSRHYISQDVLRTLRYGRFINNIGLNSNLYWRITKVLMQFEEAKRQLVRLRKQPLPKFANLNLS